MNKQEQIAEMAVLGCVRNPQAHTTEECLRCDFKQGQCNAYRHAEKLYNTGYRKLPEGAVVLTKEECDNKVILNEDHFERALNCEREKARKETAKEIFQRVINICRKEEDFQDGTVNTQLEPLYFGIMNGCVFIRGEVKDLAKEYGVEVEE